MDNISFSNYITKSFPEFYYNDVANYFLKNKETFDITSYRLPKISFTELEDIQFKYIYLTEQNNSLILFDLILCLNISMHFHSSHYDDYDSSVVWVTANCIFDLDAESTPKIIRIEPYTKKKSETWHLDDYLIPYINRQNADKYAEKILNEYYPDRNTEKPIDPLLLCQNMNLKPIFCTIDECNRILRSLKLKEFKIE